MDALRPDCDFGSFRWSFESRQLSKGGVPIRLSARALQILFVLVENCNRAMTRDAIIAQVWKIDAQQAERYLEAEKYLNTHVSEIRRALDDKAKNIIRTRHGYGYAFVTDVLGGLPDGRQDSGPLADRSSLSTCEKSAEFKTSKLDESRTERTVLTRLADFCPPVAGREGMPWVELADVSVPRTRLCPGERIEIQYVVYNNLSNPLDLWIGASLEKEKRRFYNIDEDRMIIAPPGKSTHLRSLTLPDLLEAGSYRLSASLWMGPRSNIKKSLALGRSTRIAILIGAAGSSSSGHHFVAGPEAHHKT